MEEEEEIEKLCKVPLKNRKKEIIEYALVDSCKYEEVMNYKWSCVILRLEHGKYTYARGKVDGKMIQMSHFIFGKPKKKYVIDHINNNALDNRLENLQSVSKSHNSQNRKKFPNCLSKYIGVCKCKNTNNWRVYSCGDYLGTFDNELDAATTYDKYILIKFGNTASTNNLVKDTDVINLTIEDILPIKKVRELPKYIIKIKNSYLATITYNKITYKKCYKTLDEALKQLEIYKGEINKIKLNENKNRRAKEIDRNEKNEAIITINNDKNNTIGYAIVDDNKWHQLIEFKWSNAGHNYIIGYVNGKKILMHRYLMNANEDDLIDHINRIPYDNRLNNLRVASYSLNGHNRTKIDKEYTTSTYFGVSQRYDNLLFPYRASVSKDGIKYSVGQYDNELKAAVAYNIKATELYGKDANLNILDIDDNIYQEYKNEVMQNLNKIVIQGSIYKGVKKLLTNKINDYTAHIFRNKIKYSLGNYDNETIAALAYNIKAVELDSKFTDLNILDLDTDTYKKYENEIREKWSKTKTSIYHGVRMKKDGRFTAQIYIEKKNVYIGIYENELIAAIAYNIKSEEASKKYNKKFTTNDIASLDIDETTYNNYVNEILEKWKKTKSSIYKGLCLNQGKWNVSITINGKKTYLGGYDNEIKAAIVYNLKAIEIYGNEYKKINVLDIDEALYEKYKQELTMN